MDGRTTRSGIASERSSGGEESRIAVETTNEAEVIVPRTREPGPKFKPFALGLGLTAPWLHRPPRPIPRRAHFNAREQALVERIKRLKKEAGSHSPSAWTLAKQIPELRLKVDACFLSNPYATNLFLMHLHREVIRPRKLRALLELYPSQNRVIASKLGRVLEQDPDSIFVGNGAVEIIQAILHRLTRQKILVNLPTFSPYYEFARPDTQVIFNVLRKEERFHFDPARYLDLVRRERPDTVVLINPNNPDGGYIPHAAMVELLEELRDVPNVIVDESFIHFACEGNGFTYLSVADEVRRFPNLMVVKSMSKDFGVAGIRAGYAIMDPARVRTLLDNGYLWNSSGLAEYFFDLYSRPDFQERYERERIRFIRNSRRFFAALSKTEGLRVYPTQANFALVELQNGLSAEDLVWRLLVRRGVYTRTCDDKRGLEPGKFLRIAARNRPENRYIIRSLRRLIG
jgi:histidinol-phosphate/aromatic aminotransferase/cobyric acid decarboxylase-like protein